MPSFSMIIALGVALTPFIRIYVGNTTYVMIGQTMAVDWKAPLHRL